MWSKLLELACGGSYWSWRVEFKHKTIDNYRFPILQFSKVTIYKIHFHLYYLLFNTMLLMSEETPSTPTLSTSSL